MIEAAVIILVFFLQGVAIGILIGAKLERGKGGE